MSDKMMEIVVQRISELCEERNLSLNSLARAAGLPQSTVKNIIYGASKNPGVVTVLKICDGLGISISEFFGTDEFRSLSDSYIES